MKKLDILLAILVAFAWGSNYIAIKYTVTEIPNLFSLAIRFTITSLVLFPFVQKPIMNFKNLYFTSLIMGIFYLGMLYYGLYLGLDTSLTIIIMQLNIPISIIIARFFLNERFTLSSIIGIVLAFIGMIVVIGSPRLTNNLALVAILISAISCAMFNIQSRKLQSISPLSLLCWTNLIAAPHLFIMSYFIEGSPIELILNVTYTLWFSILYTVVVAGFVGIAVWIHLLQTYPIHKVLPFNLLVPFFGISLSTLVLGDIPSWHIFIGGIITLCGIAISNIKILPFITNKQL